MDRFWIDRVGERKSMDCGLCWSNELIRGFRWKYLWPRINCEVWFEFQSFPVLKFGFTDHKRSSDQKCFVQSKSIHFCPIFLCLIFFGGDSNSLALVLELCSTHCQYVVFFQISWNRQWHSAYLLVYRWTFALLFVSHKTLSSKCVRLYLFVLYFGNWNNFWWFPIYVDKTRNSV